MCGRVRCGKRTGSRKTVAIDRKSREGRAAVQALARKADVLVENFRQGALNAFGLDYETLSADNRRLIYCSISGYGRTGPRAGEGGYRARIHIYEPTRPDYDSVVVFCW